MSENPNMPLNELESSQEALPEAKPQSANHTPRNHGRNRDLYTRTASSDVQAQHQG